MKHKQLVIGILVTFWLAWAVPNASGAPSLIMHELALALPAWQQANSNGFGDPLAGEVSALEAFNGYLYAGIHSDAHDALIYRSPDGVTWTAVIAPGFGISHDIAPRAILDFIVFNNKLYTSTGRGGDPGQIYRTLYGAWDTWAPMVIYGFGDQDNVDITALGVYNGVIYAGVTNSVTGAQIWSSPTGDNNTWTQMVAPELADSSITGFAEFDGGLYAAVQSETGAPAQIWYSYGGDWTVSDSFGDSSTLSTGGMAVFGGYLYVGAGNTTVGAQLWRTDDGATWGPVISPAFEAPNNQKVEAVFVYQNQLYVSVKNAVTGLEVWRSANGSLWEKAHQDDGGFGDSHNTGTNWGNAVADFGCALYVGTLNVTDGGELWRMRQSCLYLPLIRR